VVHQVTDGGGGIGERIHRGHRELVGALVREEDFEAAAASGVSGCRPRKRGGWQPYLNSTVIGIVSEAMVVIGGGVFLVRVRRWRLVWSSLNFHVTVFPFFGNKVGLNWAGLSRAAKPRFPRRECNATLLCYDFRFLKLPPLNTHNFVPLAPFFSVPNH
jgi:hypothetical protein